MELKFYLNKFAKIDNIENYTFKNVLSLKKAYDEFLDKSEGKDPDFPLLDFSGGKKGKTLSKGRNVYSMFDEDDIPDNFTGIETRLKDKDKQPEIRQIDAREMRHRNTRNRNNKK